MEKPMTIDRPNATRPHRISYVTGDVTADGSTIQLRVQTENDGAINLALPTVDLPHLVTLLLLLGGKAAVNGRFAASSETFLDQATSVARSVARRRSRQGITDGRGWCVNPLFFSDARQHGRDRPYDIDAHRAASTRTAPALIDAL
jgi:hypothetical protein